MGKIIFVYAILSALIVILLYLLVYTPQQQDRFTSFYVEVFEDDLNTYPGRLPYGYNLTLVIGIINNESRGVDYSVLLEKPTGIETVGNVRLGDGESYEFIYNFLVDWLDRDITRINLYKNGEMSDLQLQLWINGSTFFVLNSTYGLDIPSIPFYHRIPLEIFVMNRFNDTRVFRITMKYPYAGQNISSVQISDEFDVSLGPLEEKRLGYEPIIDKPSENPMWFSFSTENYTENHQITVDGAVFYVLNSSGGYVLPQELPAGSGLNTTVGVAYYWYTPDYRPLEFTFELKKVVDDEMTVLAQKKFTLSHASIYEFPVQLEIADGPNNFIYEISAEHFYETVNISVSGNSF